MKINSIKTLYHGSDSDFETFDLKLTKAFKDYGKGFYLTSSLRQAQKWAQKKAGSKTVTYIYCYKIQDICEREWKILELLKYDKTWIDFITESRINGIETEYDIIYDRIADSQFDKISDTLIKYNKERITSQKAIELIKWKKDDGDQYCFKTEKALTLLKRENIIVQHFINNKWEQEEYR